MVFRELLYLLATLIFLAYGKINYIEKHRIEQEIADSDQIHYKYCGEKHVCLIPSIYLKMESTGSLQITSETRIPFREGIEIDVINETAWHLTLMSNHTDNDVKFKWDIHTMLQCNKSVKGNQIVFRTNYSVVRSIGDAQLSYKDDKAINRSGLVCTFLLTPMQNSTEGMNNIFGSLVEQTQGKIMCLEVTTPENVNNGTITINRTTTEYCNYINDLVPNMKLAHHSLNCTGCPISPSINTTNTSSSFQVNVDRRRGCISIWSSESLLINNKLYTTGPATIKCSEGQWLIENRYELFSEAAPHIEEKLTSIAELESGTYLCNITSPLKSTCLAGKPCKRIDYTDSMAPFKCPSTMVLTYTFEKKSYEFSWVECHPIGAWVGVLRSDNKREMRLVPGNSMTCEHAVNKEAGDEEGDLLDDNVEESKKIVLLRRDNEVDYTSAIVAAAACVIVSIIIIIVVYCIIIACINPKKKPVGLPPGENSYEPVPTASESEMTMTRRLAFLITVVACMS